MEIPILFEDADTLVINKPVGIVVNRAESIRGETVQDWVEGQEWMITRNQELKNSRTQDNDEKVFGQRSGVCHRLDKETSGCLMIAKHGDALKYYLKQFKDRTVKKTYMALVHGRVEPNSGEVVLPLKRSLFDREKWQVHYEGKRAVTEWEVEKVFSYVGNEHFKDTLTLLRLNLKTGRTHQIRVHLSFLGWPIFADEKYLSKKFAEVDRRYLSHHFLHAYLLSFRTFGGEVVTTAAPLPEDCVRLLDSLA